VLSPEGESFGLLFGQRLHRPMKNQYIYNVTLAVPMQTAMRTKDSVNVSTLHFDRIRDVTESFPNLEFLGTFHSHPCPSKAYDRDETSIFSPEDEDSACQIAQEYGDEILEVILGITALKRHSSRDAITAEETIQSHCGRFKYSLSAYVTDNVVDKDDEIAVMRAGFAAMDAEDDEIDDEDEEDAQDDEDEEEEDVEKENDNGEACLIPVDQLICPLAAHGGGIFSRMA
jgi:hypothetical protein